jgi:hypothetical protein
MSSSVHPFSILSDCHVVMLSGRDNKSSTGNILNPVRGIGASVDMHGVSTWTLYIIASAADITTCKHNFISSFASNKIKYMRVRVVSVRI